MYKHLPIKTKESLETYFKLGQVDEYFGGPIVNLNQEPFELWEFFDWKKDFGLNSKTGNEEEWFMGFIGSLKDELIDTPERKIEYIKGVLSTYSGQGAFDELNKIVLSFANASSKFDRCAKFFQAIFFALNFHTDKINFSDYKLIQKNTMYTFPTCNALIIEGGKEFINLFK